MSDKPSAPDGDDKRRVEAALEKLWRQGRAKTMLSIPTPATGEIQVVKWRHPE